MHLVEGGRWLLIGEPSGSVLCCDLDASTIEPITLIPSPFHEGTAYQDSEILLSVDMDLDVEYLKFNLGIMTRRMPAMSAIDPDSSHYFRWIQVWEVTPDVDKNGVVTGLRADRLVCFPEEHRNFCHSFRLRDRQVAYTLLTNYNSGDFRDGPCVIIVDWINSDPTSLVFPRKVIWREKPHVSHTFLITASEF